MGVYYVFYVKYFQLYVYHCMVIIAGVKISKSGSSAKHTGEENETKYEVVR